MRILISGAGIAGPTLAYWLVHHGMQATIVEQAPRLRTAGYVVDFWGAGFDVAERMGILPEIKRKGYLVREVRVVDRCGKRVAGFPADVFFKAAQGRYISLPRGDLAASIYGAVENKVETIFGDAVARIEPSAGGLRVTFERGHTREFDLVVGADGLHSRIRELVFGSQSRFETYLGYKVAAFEVKGYHPRDELVFVMYTEVHQQVSRFAMRGDRTMFLFIFADEQAETTSPNDLPAQKALLRARFGKSGWECPRILDALDASREVYFDRISQIRMGGEPGMWTRDRVTLIGDAAFCVSLLAGQGSALAMAGAYILAGELAKSGGDYATAFSRYEQAFAPFVRRKQNSALRFAGFFAPPSRAALFIRNQVMKLLRIPWVADLALTRDLEDTIVLPEY